MASAQDIRDEFCKNAANLNESAAKLCELYPNFKEQNATKWMISGMKYVCGYIIADVESEHQARIATQRKILEKDWSAAIGLDGPGWFIHTLRDTPSVAPGPPLVLPCIPVATSSLTPREMSPSEQYPTDSEFPPVPAPELAQFPSLPPLPVWALSDSNGKPKQPPTGGTTPEDRKRRAEDPLLSETPPAKRRKRDAAGPPRFVAYSAEEKAHVESLFRDIQAVGGKKHWKEMVTMVNLVFHGGKDVRTVPALRTKYRNWIKAQKKAAAAAAAAAAGPPLRPPIDNDAGSTSGSSGNADAFVDDDAGSDMDDNSSEHENLADE